MYLVFVAEQLEKRDPVPLSGFWVEKYAFAALGETGKGYYLGSSPVNTQVRKAS